MAPDLIVLSHKSSQSKGIEEIREILKNDGKYFKEYNSDEDIKNLIGEILDKYVSRKEDEERIKRQKKEKEERIQRNKAVRKFFIYLGIICGVFMLWVARYATKQKYIDRMAVAIEELEKNPSNIENNLSLRKVISKYEKLGYPKDNEVYKKAKKHLK